MSKFEKECMGIVNQLFDLAEVPVDKRQQINDKAFDYMMEQVKNLTIPDVSQQRELLKKWWKYLDDESVAVNCNEQEREEVINAFNSW